MLEWTFVQLPAKRMLGQSAAQSGLAKTFNYHSCVSVCVFSNLEALPFRSSL
jgi:hypothetical protein